MFKNLSEVNEKNSQNYISGAWVQSNGSGQQELVNPATEEVYATLTLGNAGDVDRAVRAARSAFDDFAATDISERLEYLKAINAELERLNDEIADLITLEMGAPKGLSRDAQATSGTQHFREIIRVLEAGYRFEEPMGNTLVRKEAVGVCALITPWNWPLNQIATKVAPALAAGCTMVLKPSELAPLSAIAFAEIVDSAGLPPGVFNMVHGNGAEAGSSLVAHPDVDMISFTGSTRAGQAISQSAAVDIKRVSLELGGKSASIILPNADLNEAIPAAVASVMVNSGQSCNARTRILVPENTLEETLALAATTASNISFGNPAQDGVAMGPIANKAQYERVKTYLGKAEGEGVPLVAGGLVHNTPDVGFYIAPTVFGPVSEAASLAVEEVFGPVAAIMTYKTVDDAIRIANDSEYGLSGGVWGGDHAEAVLVASKLRTGMVHINGAGLDSSAPFGGYKKSGHGREWGVFGLEEFLEIKSIYGAV